MEVPRTNFRSTKAWWWKCWPAATSGSKTIRSTGNSQSSSRALNPKSLTGDGTQRELWNTSPNRSSKRPSSSLNMISFETADILQQVDLNFEKFESKVLFGWGKWIAPLISGLIYFVIDMILLGLTLAYVRYHSACASQSRLRPPQTTTSIPATWPAPRTWFSLYSFLFKGPWNVGRDIKQNLKKQICNLETFGSFL